MTVQIIELDDWIAIYKDRKIRYQNHSIDPVDLLQILGVEFEYAYLDDDKWISKNGWHCPEYLTQEDIAEIEIE